jgi:hypothetical protein
MKRRCYFLAFLFTSASSLAEERSVYIAESPTFADLKGLK